MMKNDEGTATAPRTVYKMDAGLRIVGYGAGALIAAMGIGLGALYLSGVDITGRRPDLGPIGTALGVLFFVVIGATMAHTVRSTRLVLSAEGAEYRTMGYPIVTRWENVRGVGPARYGRSTAESLLLREPMLRENGPFGALVRAMGSMPDDAIPLQGLGSARYGPLSRDLKRCAPHLFGPDGRPIPHEPV